MLSQNCLEWIGVASIMGQGAGDRGGSTAQGHAKDGNSRQAPIAGIAKSTPPAKAEIDRILAATISDPIGPEFMAPAARSFAAA